MDKATYLAFFTLNAKLNRILNILGDEIMPELDALTDAVARVEAAADAAATKLQQLIEQGGSDVDPAVLQALTDRLVAVGEKLEAVGGTPA